jgi:hypothetical protein
MAVRTRSVAVVLLLLLFPAACSWLGDERSAVGARLEAFRKDVNTHAPEGLGTITHAASLASYFTEDVSVELGDGTAPLRGREMLMGMAARLQPRMAEFQLELADVNVHLAPDRKSADVNLTAEFIDRTHTTRRSRDAREFALTVRLDDGEWRIARVVAVQTLK